MQVQAIVSARELVAGISAASETDLKVVGEIWEWTSPGIGAKLLS